MATSNRSTRATSTGVEPLDTERLEPVQVELEAVLRERVRGEGAQTSLQVASLVQEAWHRLERTGAAIERAEFLRCAATAMRSVLLERARDQARQPRAGAARGGDAEWFETADLGRGQPLGRLVAFDQAIARLEQRDPDVARVVRLRYYAGLSLEDTAVALAQSTRAVRREWTCARAWLQHELAPRE